MFDSHFCFKDHITDICKSSFYHLRNISYIRKYLSATTTELLVHMFVSSKLDYCNSLLYGLPAYAIKKATTRSKCRGAPRHTYKKNMITSRLFFSIFIGFPLTNVLFLRFYL
ncbi:unnamed protein product [Pocillopora meandrina]|uniref:Uncharacterized protein n=1 Tax=Pocillopora meandrina TaxID=46732 RepID=A0AAU9X966_9CNID|nr:unnamed protein product [Pocillopora meandrina]